MDNIILGLDLFLLGCMKKLLIANRASIYVDAVYSNPAGFDGLTAWLATVAYAFQIYCDFSGYSDMAIGLAKCFDYEIIINFRTPYLARNIAEFWQRWHITLSTWLRDYLFMPLGGYRGSKLLSYRNLFITMFLGGLWHGAAWTFVAWGAYHGFLLILRQVLKQPTQSIFSRLKHPVSRWAFDNASRLLVFLLVCLGWVFFRAQSFHDALHLFGKMFGVIGGGDRLISNYTLIVVAIMIAYDLIAYRLEANKTQIGARCLQAAPFLRAACYVAAIAILVVFSPHGVLPFIYFQF
jgi:alginate O-acetyltransferase complex protein AlgI